MLACTVWVLGALIIHTGVWMVDKTIKLPLGSAIIAGGSAIQFAALVMLIN